MSLRVWLPLRGDLRNQGLDEITVTNSGAVVDNSGKIGKCYSFDGSNDYLSTPYNFYNSTYSICAWIYTTSTATQCICCDRTSVGSGFAIFLYNKKLRIDSGGNGLLWETSYTFPMSTWFHLAIVYDGTATSYFINGELQDKKNQTISSAYWGNTTSIGASQANGSSYDNYLNGRLNDFRIYDHALSAKEIKEISKALVIHYPLDDISQELDNCYVYPTFNTSTAGGGWSHWGPSGNAGTYGQNTDKQYIFHKNNLYSHWVANGENTTKNYLVYQSPAFDGGYRSIQFIIKEENSSSITESICFPDWNSSDGDVLPQKWTSISYLGDGFYLCKVEGLHQSGSNDLIGVYVRPGYKIYISEGYCENNRIFCSDIFFPYTNIIENEAGYSNQGTAAGTITSISDSPRYNQAIHFDGNKSYFTLSEPMYDLYNHDFTYSVWLKPEDKTRGVVFSEYGGAGASNVAFELNASLALRIYWNGSPDILNGATILTQNEWNYVAITKTDSEIKFYVNGVLKYTYTQTGTWSTRTSTGHPRIGDDYRGNSSNTVSYMGGMSDFRFYATALSSEDIKELYEVGMSIDNKQNIHTYEIDEAGAIGISKTGTLTSKTEFIEEADDPNVHLYKSGEVTANHFYEE